MNEVSVSSKPPFLQKEETGGGQDSIENKKKEKQPPLKTHMVTVQSIIHVQQTRRLANGLKPSCSLKGPTDMHSSEPGAATPAGQETISYANLCGRDRSGIGCGVGVVGVSRPSALSLAALCSSAIMPYSFAFASAATAAGTSQGKYVWGRWRRFVFRTV